VSLVALLAAAGCASRSAPRLISDTGPWIAPHQQAREYKVLVKPSYIDPMYGAMTFSDTYWVDARGRKHKPLRVQQACEDYLVKTGVPEQWPPTGTSIDEYWQRRAPYEFWVVSLNPTVVLMTEAARSPNDKPPRQDEGGLQRFERAFRYATAVPHTPRTLWFSPDLHAGPYPIDTSGPSARIPLGPAQALDLQRQGSRWHVTRISTTPR
jgi:hypothetical protein